MTLDYLNIINTKFVNNFLIDLDEAIINKFMKISITNVGFYQSHSQLSTH
jgi:hypothetical protein